MSFTPRNYQIKLDADSDEAWQNGHRNVIAVSPTGSGKTKFMGMKARKLTRPGVAIAHRKELVGQISTAMAELGVPHRLIAADGTIRNCIQRHIKVVGQSWVNPRAPFTVSSIDTLLVRADDPGMAQWASEIGLWMVDECFPAGTLIDGRPIETVAVGDMVTAFDESTGLFESKRVERLFKNPMPDQMIQIVSAAHHVLHTTKGHPFWTQRGWVNAGQLLENDLLLMVRQTTDVNQGIAEVSAPQNRSDLLHPDVRIPASGCSTGLSQADSEVMSGLQSTSATAVEVLRQDLRGKCEVKKVIGNHDPDQFQIRFGSNEGQQPDGERGESRGYAGDTQSNRSQTISAGGERKAANLGGGDVDGSIGSARLRVTGGCANGSQGAVALQDRLRASPIEDCSGSRWSKSPIEGSAGIGCAQGCVSEWVRVANIQVLERRNPDFPAGNFVYNIEVADHHTYVANGITVHNCHHLLEDNKWGRGIKLFPNAYGLGVTATPLRADRKSLSRLQGGVFDHMILGPTMRDLINSGSLCEYKVYVPPASMDRANLIIGSTGDFTPNSMRDEARKHKVKIVGDIVQTYLRLAPGKRGICFAIDVEQAVDIAAAFNEAGVRAAAVSAQTPEAIRDATIDKFEYGKLDMLVNVDLFGEGFDVPAVEVVIMARPTESYGLYVQQFGRALRTLIGKLFGIIIDHVGNVLRHGLPDAPRAWKLFDDEVGKRRKKDPNVIPITACTACYLPYEAFRTCCPFCGHKPVPAGRSTPEQVAGDLVELDPAVLKIMRGEADAIMQDNPVVVTDARTKMIAQSWGERIEAQKELRDRIATWAWKYHVAGETDSEIQKRFWYRFGQDVLTAQALGAREAHNLKMEIDNELSS